MSRTLETTIGADGPRLAASSSRGMSSCANLLLPQGAKDLHDLLPSEPAHTLETPAPVVTNQPAVDRCSKGRQREYFDARGRPFRWGELPAAKKYDPEAPRQLLAQSKRSRQVAEPERVLTVEKQWGPRRAHRSNSRASCNRDGICCDARARKRVTALTARSARAADSCTRMESRSGTGRTDEYPPMNAAARALSD